MNWPLIVVCTPTVIVLGDDVRFAIAGAVLSSVQAASERIEPRRSAVRMVVSLVVASGP